MPEIVRLASPTPSEREAIVAPLDEFSRAQGFAWQPEPLAVALRGDADRIVGGAIGETNWGWLYITVLAVARELRGQGWGSRLVREMERLAVARGCLHAWVDTFSVQARPFYERLGYKVFGTLPNYPREQERYFLSKDLQHTLKTSEPAPEPQTACEEDASAERYGR